MASKIIPHEQIARLVITSMTARESAGEVVPSVDTVCRTVAESAGIPVEVVRQATSTIDIQYGSALSSLGISSNPDSIPPQWGEGYDGHRKGHHEYSPNDS